MSSKEMFFSIFFIKIHSTQALANSKLCSMLGFHNTDTNKQHVVLLYNPAPFLKILALWLSL